MKALDWNKYWQKASENNGLYARIAHFYRKHIISRSLKYYFHKYFMDRVGTWYLHAGCGSAESDCRIRFSNSNIVLLDKSLEALRLARKKTKFKNVHFVCGDIFNPPFKKESFHGIWNLGVMEHFYQDEIVKIFKALSKVLKKGEKALFFWPPIYGLSVIVLSSFLFITNKVLKKNKSLYPDEISRYRSKKWVTPLLKKGNLSFRNAYFSVHDLFTHTILVAEKENSK